MTVLAITALDLEPLKTDFVSLNEYRSSTPATFSLEELPILYYAADGLVLTSTDLHHRPKNAPLKTDEFVTFHKRCETGITVNVMVVSSRLFLWFPGELFGYSIPYTSISLHGITKDTTLYLQLSIQDESLFDGSSGSTDPSPGPSHTPSTSFPELFIKTNSSAQVHEFYKAMNECSNLHADTADSDNEHHGSADSERDQSFTNLMAAAMSGGIPQTSGPAPSTSFGAQGIDEDYYDMEIDVPLAEKLCNDPKLVYERPADSVFSNRGDADDLDMDIDLDSYGDEDEEVGGILEGHWLTDGYDNDESNAGMQIEISNEDDVKAGIRRRRDEEEENDEGDIENDEDYYLNRRRKTIGLKKSYNFNSLEHQRDGGKWRRIG